jgi:hypothetical protein
MSVNDAQQYHTNQVHFLRKTVAYTDSSAVSLGWLPAGAVVIDGAAVVTTAFNAATTNTMDIGFRNAGDGTSDDTDEFMSAVAVGSVGQKAADDLATAGDLLFPSGAEIVATYAQSGTAATAGSAVVWVAYIVDNT